jgi:ABC-type transporter Mla MlaB component
MNKKVEDLNKKVEDLNKKAEELKNETIWNINKIMSADSAGLRNLVDIYDLYKKDPSSMTAWEIQKAKELARYFISDCKKYGIDYKKLLSPEVRRFYGIE